MLVTCTCGRAVDRVCVEVVGIVVAEVVRPVAGPLPLLLLVVVVVVAPAWL